MNPDLQSALTAILEQIHTVAETQLPLVLKEMLTYGMIFHAFGLVFCVAMAVGGGYGLRAIIRFSKNSADEGLVVLGGMGSGLLLLIGTIIACYDVMQLVKIVYAPRLYLIEQLRMML